MHTPMVSQLALDLETRPSLTRDDFIVSAENQSAVYFIDEWPNWQQNHRAHGLVLWGERGCGKSHLAHLWQEKSGALSVHNLDLNITDKDNLVQQFQGFHLWVDHADLWIGDLETETFLFHLYNQSQQTGHNIVLTMRSNPMNLGFLLPDLGSRLRGLPAFYIQPPSDELLQAILMKLMNDRQLMVNPEMIHYLLPRMDRSFAAAQSLVKAIDEYSLAHHRKITIPLLRDVLYNAYKDESPFTG